MEASTVKLREPAWEAGRSRNGLSLDSTRSSFKGQEEAVLHHLLQTTTEWKPTPTLNLKIANFRGFHSTSQASFSVWRSHKCGNPWRGHGWMARLLCQGRATLPQSELLFLYTLSDPSNTHPLSTLSARLSGNLSHWKHTSSPTLSTCTFQWQQVLLWGKHFPIQGNAHVFPYPLH